MIYHGQISNGQVRLDKPVALPEGTPVDVEIRPRNGSISRPAIRMKPRKIDPIEIPGPSLAEDLVRDRR